MNRFLTYYKKTKQKIDKKVEKFNKNLGKNDNLLLQDNINYFKELNGDGKRIRGVLVNLGYYLLKENKDYSLDLSLAYEIFQTGILIHDDIIDKDDKRRGKDTIHFANIKKYQNHSKNTEEVKHLGNSLAICMGNYGFYQANLIIAESYQKDPNLGKVLQNFTNTVLTTIKGELIDVILPFEGKHHLLDLSTIEEHILEIYRLKTAHYTIVGPLSVGLILAGADEKKLKDIEKFGEKVGIAFQIQDDILGIYSDEIGKVKGSDIKEFKQTILYSHIINTKQKNEFLKVYGKDKLTETTIKRVQELLKKSGSFDYAIHKMNTMYDESLKILENMNWIPEKKKEYLQGFVEYLRTRNK